MFASVIDQGQWDRATDDDLAAEARSLQDERNRLDAREADLLSEVEARRRLRPDRHRCTEAWLCQATGISRTTARSRVEVARQLPSLPFTRDDFAHGLLHFDQVRQLARLANSRHRDRLIEDEADLAEAAIHQTADAFARTLAAWEETEDTARDAEVPESERQYRRRSLRSWKTRHGTRAGRFEVTDELWALIGGQLGDLLDEERRAEPPNLPVEQQRTHEQRLIDALAEMARRSAGTDGATKYRARPTIVAYTQIDVLRDKLRVNGSVELSDGTTITARQLRRLACEADIIPMVLDTDGVVLDQGRRVRRATLEQRLALRGMHRHCAVRGCDIPFAWCEIHHLDPWESGGLTDLDNLRPLCSYHHHLTHDANWPLHRLPDRAVDFCPNGYNRPCDHPDRADRCRP